MSCDKEYENVADQITVRECWIVITGVKKVTE